MDSAQFHSRGAHDFLLPRSDGVGALFGVVSIGGVTTFGIVADTGAVPELEFLATAIERSLADLARDDA